MLSVIGVSTAGFLSDRFGARPTVTATFISTFLGIILLFVLSYFPSQWALALFVLFFGLAQGARGPDRLDDIGTDFSRPSTNDNLRHYLRVHVTWRRTRRLCFWVIL